MKRGIYLVANYRSQEICQNLIYSIRESGCTLPIRLIHFGGREVNSKYLLSQVEILRYDEFPQKAKEFILNLRSVLTDCPLGYLYRYLAWFSDWDEFIYSDNDVVALCNWENLFEYISDHDLIHADEEYITKGIYNYNKPEKIQEIFGNSALESAMTAGHIIVRRSEKMVKDINDAVNWFKQNPNIPKKHDQSLMHIASLVGNWRMVNLCKPPYSWLSSWAGDYKNSLELIHKIQTNQSKISHIHFSGGTPKGDLAIQELLLSCKNDKDRLIQLSRIGFSALSGYDRCKSNYYRIRKFLNKKIDKK